MCARSDTKIREEKVVLEIGYHAGRISIGDFKYEVGGSGYTREDLINKLRTYTKDELTVLVADLVDCGGED